MQTIELLRCVVRVQDINRDVLNGLLEDLASAVAADERSLDYRITFDEKNEDGAQRMTIVWTIEDDYGLADSSAGEDFSPRD